MPHMPAPPPVNPYKKSISASKRAAMIASFAIFLAILTSLFAGYSWQQFARIKEAIQKNVMTLQASKQQSQQFQNDLTTVQDNLTHVIQTVTKTKAQRELADAAQLVQLANLNLSIGRDVPTALRLLRITNQHLKTISSPTVHRLKTAVRQDIIKLQSAPTVDVAGIVSRLDNIIQGIQNLPGQHVKRIKQTLPLLLSDNDAHMPWYKKILASLESLKQLIVIRHITKPIEPLLSPEQQLYLRQNIQFKLYLAEWAVVHKNKVLYTSSLMLAQHWLRNHYQNHIASAPLIKQMRALAAINIKPKLPTITASLNALYQAQKRPSFLQQPKLKPTKLKPIITKPSPKTNGANE